MTAGSIIDQFHEEYIHKIGISSKKLYDILLRVLAEHTDAGVLSANRAKLAELDSIIKKALKDSGYSAATDQYFSAFPALETYNSTYYAKEDLSVEQAISGSDILDQLKKEVLDSLRSGGLQQGVIKPLESLIRQEIFLNKTYQQAADLLRSKLVDNSIIVKHVDNIAFDTLNHYNGAINNEVRRKYGLEWFNYIGSIKDNTRPICDHIRVNYNRSIHIDELKTILDEYCPGGQPSDALITYTTVNNTKLTLPKGSGMMPGTTVENYSLRKGGYRCRHDVKWTRYPVGVS